MIDDIKKWELAIEELNIKYSDQELLAIISSFDKIIHILGPFAFFTPTMDDEFNTFSAQEYIDEDPTKIGPKSSERLKFLLDHYNKALPLIEAGIKYANAEKFQEAN